MSNKEVYAAVKASIEDSLVQLGRGSGITPEHRANMVTIIAAPLGFIIEEAIYGAIEAMQRERDEARAEVEQMRAASRDRLLMDAEYRLVRHMSDAVVTVDGFTDSETAIREQEADRGVGIDSSVEVRWVHRTPPPTEWRALTPPTPPAEGGE